MPVSGVQRLAVRRLLDGVEDPRTLGLFRIGLGLLLIADVWALWPHAAYLYGDASVWPAAEVCTGLRRASLLCVLPGTAASWVVVGLFTLCAGAFTLGAFTRVTKWLTAYLFLSVVLRNGLPLAGEQVFGSFLFLLCLSRCDAAFSIDNVRRRRRDDGPVHRMVPAWPRHLMILQLCIAYGVAGWAKTGATWEDGTSFYYVLSNDRWFRFPPWWLLSTFGTNLLRAATFVAWWFERLFPLVGLGLLFGARSRVLRWLGSRWIWAPLSIAFTGVLVVLTNIGWFVPAMLVATIVLFRGDEVGRAVARVQRRPFDAAVRAPDRPARRHNLLLAAFVGWHALAMAVNAAALPSLTLPMPTAVREATQAYARLTNTVQYWGMFSPRAPRSRRWLVVDVVSEDGATQPAFDDRRLIGARVYPYFGLDRRQKIHSRIAGGHRGHHEHHARYVCRTWRDAAGRPPTQVVLSTRTWPLPHPRWMAGRPADPRPLAERYRRDRELLRWACGPAD